MPTARGTAGQRQAPLCQHGYFIRGARTAAFWCPEAQEQGQLWTGEPPEEAFNL